MTTKTKNTILIFAVVVTVSCLTALVFAKWEEAVIFIACHTLIRPQFDRQYHHIKPELCRVISAMVIFFGISFILPLSYSLFSAIPINYFIGWVGQVKASSDYYEQKTEKLHEKLMLATIELSDPRGKLLRLCAKAKLSARDTRIAEMYYIERKTPKDIWLWISQQKEYEYIEWDTVYQTIWRIGKKLKNVENS